MLMQTFMPTSGPILSPIVYIHVHVHVGPSWLKNLYFAYLLVLRAVTKAEPFWKHFTFYTGDPIQEREIKENVLEIVQAAK